MQQRVQGEGFGPRRGWPTGLVVVASAIVFAHCGGSTPNAKSAHDPSEPTGWEPTPDSSAEKPASDKTGSPEGEEAESDPAAAPPPSSSCPYETTEPIKSQYGTAEVTGCLKPEKVQAAVMQSYSRIRTCYQQQLAANPKLKGTVSVRLNLSDSGVKSVTVKRTNLGEQDFIDCVISSLKQISIQGNPKEPVLIDLSSEMNP